jgi:hypothetical protein
MFRRCIFCRGDLGTNEEMDFSVGKRLAFDAEKGRLWVICPHCARWNLSPLEERWEAIESAERLYRGTKQRVATDNIGLAQVGDKVDLIRIGAPLRPEFAAWRYGSEFLKRRTKAMVFAAVDAVVTIAAFAASGVSFGFWGAFGGNTGGLGQLRQMRERRAGGTIIPLEDGTAARVFSFSAGESKLVRLDSGEVGLQLHYWEPRPDATWSRKLGIQKAYTKGTPLMLTNEQMIPALRHLLPLANGEGAKQKFVTEAVDRLERQGDLKTVIHHAIPHVHGRWSDRDKPLSGVDAAARLALEMALHEGDERAAMEGELQALHDRWREAEEIAAIADDLLLPDSVRQRLGELGGGEKR